MKNYRYYKKLFWLLILLCIIIPNSLKSQELTSNHNVLISGYLETHDLDVKQAFLIGYSSYNGSEFGGNIELYYDYAVTNSINYAEENNYDIIVRSYSRMSSYINLASQHPDIELIMPSGSNSSELTFSGDLENCPIIVTGAGTTSNVTGYQVDFYSIDPITSSNLSSFANGYIAGQIAFISDYLGKSIDEARLIARETGSNGGIYDYQNGYGSIDVGEAISSPTPVELVSFTGTSIDGIVVLEWATATEVNNYGWEVERSFENSQLFETIGFVEGHGNSNSPLNYSYNDKPEQYGKYLYRIKQVDNDGTIEYSGTVNVIYGHNKLNHIYLSSYPNPFNPKSTIVFSMDYNSFVNLQVFNSLGERVTDLYSGILNAGEYSFTFSGKDFSSGMYIILLQTDRENIKRKILLLK